MGGKPDEDVASGFYPGQASIDAVGDGGFRFAGMGHRGGLLILPDGMQAWLPVAASALTLADFAPVLAAKDRFDFLLLGTGSDHVLPPDELMAALHDAGITVEVMATRAACRTFNVLLNEGRSVAAALLPVA